jgi:hypothetical protein
MALLSMSGRFIVLLVLLWAAIGLPFNLNLCHPAKECTEQRQNGATSGRVEPWGLAVARHGLDIDDVSRACMVASSVYLIRII